jgi:YfiH family protein
VTSARAGDARGRQLEADIITSADQTLAVAVQVADCVPLLLVDRRTRSVAAAHAGWRGLASRAPGAAVDSLARDFGSRPAEIVAAVGPAIGACCYEVGPEVRERFQAAAFNDDQIRRWFETVPARFPANPSLPAVARPRADRWFFDAWAATREQLRQSGVPAGQIFVAGLCTASHPDVLCSYRRDGAPAGRMAAAIRSAALRP